MSFLYSSTAIAYVKSTSIAVQFRKMKKKNFGTQCRCHSRSSQYCACYLEASRTRQFFPIRSWVDLRHVCYLALFAISFPALPKLLFVCHSPRPSSPSPYPTFRVHFTRGDCHLPLH